MPRPVSTRPFAAAALLVALLGLPGCKLLEAAGIESAATLAERREAEGKAVGGACRHAGRAIEDCYALNRRADKAAVFAGWREMNDYMRENKIEPVAPSLGPAQLAAAPREGTGEAAEARPKPAAAKAD